MPDAAIPITTSLSDMLCFCKSNQPCVLESSANSTASLIAISPPAIIATIRSLETPKVGGHSEASTTPNLPEVPAPI